MSVKQEYSDTSDAEMTATWQRVTAPYRDLLVTGQSVPTLGAVRGKVVVMTRNGGIPGIPWPDSAHVSDDYSINTLEQWRERKLPGVKKALDAAARGRLTEFYITFTSSTGYALTPRSAAEHMQTELTTWLDARLLRAGERLGVVPFDFANPGKIEQVGARNFGRRHWGS